MKNNAVIKQTLMPICSMLVLLWLPVSGSGAVPTTRQQTILPRTLPPDTPPIAPSNVPMYAVYGYSAWDLGAGTNEGRKFTLMPAGYTGSGNAARLLSFFSISDIHITDKESPAQVPYLGWSAGFTNAGIGGLNPSAYSPIILDTTHRLDDAVMTINALHQQAMFDFGIAIGDMCNASQLNELRWFIDVMDGQYITPSSGTNAGARAIDYQMPFQAAGLEPSIPWYAAIGNHDQMWMGIGYPTEKIKQALVGSNVLNISTNGPLVSPGSEGVGMYVGVVDGTTPYGTVIKWGLTNLFDMPPTVAADPDRRSLTTGLDSPTNFVNEFFNTTSFPQGHGFTRGATGSLAACYAFEPLADIPIKVIVLDNTCKSNELGQSALFYGNGWVDAVRYAWLTNELQMGQDADQLMIIACHIPILPQTSLTNTNRVSMFYDYASETNLVATLHNYPNLLMVMAGHRHLNVVTPFPSPDPDRPECGFWEVETPSLRDFPQQFRTWDIRRNSDNSISILTTCVDPAVETNSPAWKSRGYGIAAERLFGRQPLDDTSSHTYNAELVKKLTPAMQAKIARLGVPLQLGGHDYDGDGKSDLTAFNAEYGVFSMFLSGDNYVRTIAPIPLNVNPSAIGVQPIPGDFDGDGKADPAVYDPIACQWLVLYSSQSNALYTLAIGDASCVPVSGDFDGDGKADPALYSAAAGQMAVWFSDSGYAVAMTPLGGAGWLTASGDYDGDGKTDPGVYHPASGIWIVLLSSAVYASAVGVTAGGVGFVPVPGDYDGDGKADLMVCYPAGGFWQCTFSAQGYTNTQSVTGFGGPTMAALAGGDYDNDGKADPAVYDPVTRTFRVMLSGSNYGTASLNW
ncbi:MAG: TIGR03768 family metallophosphoesterase [Verrucomicrobiota bacterium]